MRTTIERCDELIDIMKQGGLEFFANKVKEIKASHTVELSALKKPVRSKPTNKKIIPENKFKVTVTEGSLSSTHYFETEVLLNRFLKQKHKLRKLLFDAFLNQSEFKVPVYRYNGYEEFQEECNEFSKKVDLAGMNFNILIEKV